MYEEDDYLEVNGGKGDGKKPRKAAALKGQETKAAAPKEAPTKPEAGKAAAKEPAKETPEEAKPEKAGVDDDDKAKPRKNVEKAREHVETDVDKLYEIVREKGIIKVKEAAKLLGIDTEQVEEWGRILEEHKLVRLRYPPVGEPVLVLRRFTTDEEKIGKLKGRRKAKPARKVFIINLAIIICFAIFIAIYTVRLPAIRISYFQAFLAVAAIIIIGIVLVLKFVKRRKDAGKKAEKGEIDPKN